MHESLPSRRNFFKTLLVGSAAGASLLAIGPADALAADVDLKALPPKVRAAADKAVPGAKWTGASKDEDGGEVTYSLEGTDSKGRDVTVEVSAAGEVEEVMTEIPLAEVPATVMAALKAKMPKFEIAGAVAMSQGGAVDGYEFDGKRPKDKEEITVYVSADGKTIEIED